MPIKIPRSKYSILHLYAEKGDHEASLLLSHAQAQTLLASCFCTCTVPWLLQYPDNFTYSQNSNMSGQRIFDAENRRCNRSFYLAALKGQIAIDHLATHKFQSFAVAQGLCADDFYSFQR